MCLAKHSVTSDFVREERWQSGRMRIIANDVTPEMGSEGSNPSLSVQARISNAGFFVAQRSAGKVASNFCCGF